MEWIERMNEAINYIEEHLEDEVDPKVLLKITKCSYNHFQKVFMYMANVTLADYIRRRKLTLAIFRLQQTDDKVIDIALRYGYDSPTSFTRAFSRLHGMTPSEVRNGTKTYSAFLPIQFHISIKGGTRMNFRIEKKEAFNAIGLKLTTTMKNQESNREIPIFWQTSFQNGDFMKVAQKNNMEPKGVLGISVIDSDIEDQFDYYIAVASSEKESDNLTILEVPACEWAIFECIGAMPDAIQTLQQRIWTEWLPTSGYEYANTPDIELYIDEDQSKPDTKNEVWLPIQKKK